nr:hypothetical protein [Candidatus Sigynarchaeota archaeon]
MKIDVTTKRYAIITALIIAAGVAIFAAFSMLITGTRTIPVGEFDIVDFEFVWTAGQADLIMQAWGQAIVTQELAITYLDYGYLSGYGLLAVGLLLLGARLVDKNERFMRFGFAFVFLSIVSPACDAIENVNLIVMLSAFPANAIPVNAILASSFALVKFGMLFAAIGVFGAEVIYALATRKSRAQA